MDFGAREGSGSIGSPYGAAFGGVMTLRAYIYTYIGVSYSREPLFGWVFTGIPKCHLGSLYYQKCHGSWVVNQVSLCRRYPRRYHYVVVSRFDFRWLAGASLAFRAFCFSVSCILWVKRKPAKWGGGGGEFLDLILFGFGPYWWQVTSCAFQELGTAGQGMALERALPQLSCRRPTRSRDTATWRPCCALRGFHRSSCGLEQLAMCWCAAGVYSRPAGDGA